MGRLYCAQLPSWPLDLNHWFSITHPAMKVSDQIDLGIWSNWQWAPPDHCRGAMGQASPILTWAWPVFGWIKATCFRPMCGLCLSSLRGSIINWAGTWFIYPWKPSLALCTFSTMAIGVYRLRRWAGPGGVFKPKGCIQAWTSGWLLNGLGLDPPQSGPNYPLNINGSHPIL